MKRFWPRVLSTFSTFAVGLAAASVLRLFPPPSVSVRPPCPAAEVKGQPPPAVETEQTPPPETGPNVSSRFTNYFLSEKAEGFYENAADYPQLAAPTTANERRFNRHVEALIKGRFENAGTQGRALIRELQRRGEAPRTVGALTTSYEILFASRDFISVGFTHSYYWTFHPVNSFESVNYDLKTGRALRLRDIFKPGAKYLQALSRLSRARLVELLQYSEADDWMKEGTAPAEKNFAAWNLTPGGLVLSFADYQVGPYAVGAPSVTIPLADLRGSLKGRWRLRQALPH